MSQTDLVIPNGMVDIKPPLAIHDVYPLWYYLLFAVAAVIVFLLVYFFIKKFKRFKNSYIDAEILLSPEQKALDRINRFEKALTEVDSFNVDKDKRESFFLLSDILKEYLFLKTGIDCVHMTEAEILNQTSGILSPDAYGVLKSISQKLESLKFLKSDNKVEEIYMILSSLKKFVNIFYGTISISGEKK